MTTTEETTEAEKSKDVIGAISGAVPDDCGVSESLDGSVAWFHESFDSLVRAVGFEPKGAALSRWDAGSNGAVPARDSVLTVAGGARPVFNLTLSSDDEDAAAPWSPFLIHGIQFAFEEDMRNVDSFVKLIAKEFRIEHLVVSRAELTDEKRLGKGAYGEVKLVRDKEGRPHALKLIALDDASTKRTVNETGVMAACLGEPMIVQLTGVTWDDKAFGITMEFLDGGTLHELYERCGALEEPLVRYVAYCLFRALAFLHSKNILHRDIKLDNVLLDQLGHVKLSDFGLALESPDGRAQNAVGTELFLLLETTKDYSTKADVRSLMLALQLLAWGRYPRPAPEPTAPVSRPGETLPRGGWDFGTALPKFPVAFGHTADEFSALCFRELWNNSEEYTSTTVMGVEGPAVFSSPYRPNAVELMSHTWLLSASTSIDALKVAFAAHVNNVVIS